MMFSRQEKITLVNRSPESVAKHDKAAWLELFSDNAVIEDPVGTAPHRRRDVDSSTGQDAFSRFYDTFIAPNTIMFDVRKDIVCDNDIVRDATINIDMGSASISVPTHLHYELVNENGKLKIARLAAHWELFPMMQTLFASGNDVLPVLMSLSSRMLKNQGILGAMGFASGINVFAKRQKLKVAQLLSAITHKDEQTLLRWVSTSATFNRERSDFAPTLATFVHRLGSHIEFTKMLAAGRFVTVNMECQQGGALISGVGLFEFDRFGRRIIGLSFYHEPATAVPSAAIESTACREVENVP